MRIDAAEPVPEAHFLCRDLLAQADRTARHVRLSPQRGQCPAGEGTAYSRARGRTRPKDAMARAGATQLAGLNQQHTAVLGELEERNRWADKLDRDIQEARATSPRLQQDVARFDDLVGRTKARLPNWRRTSIRRPSGRGMSNRPGRETEGTRADRVEYLHQAEKTRGGATHWAMNWTRGRRIEGTLNSRLATLSRSAPV